MMRTRGWTMVPVLLYLVVCGAGRGDQPQWPGKYGISPIEVAGRTEARAINHAGMVVGVAYGKDGGLQGFVYYPNGWLIRATGQIVAAPKGEPAIRDFRAFRAPHGAQLLAISSFEPVAINNRMLVAGTYLDTKGTRRFCVACTDRDEAELSGVEAPAVGRAGLNQKGDAAFGHYRWNAAADRARREPPIDLTPWVCDQGFAAEAISDDGLIAGSMTTDSTHGTTVPFLLENQKLTTLVPAPRKGSIGAAHAVSDRGEVVGESDGRPFRWMKGSLTLLPLIASNEAAVRNGPPSNGSARAINAEGVIVGVNERSGRRRAVLWQEHRVYDLNALVSPDSGWVLEEATGINQEGRICGNGTYHGRQCGFLLTPRPRAVR